MTQKDVARTCHATVITVRTWIADGRLPAYRVGPKMIRIKRSDVDALLSPMPTTSRPGTTMLSLEDKQRALCAHTGDDPPATAIPAATRDDFDEVLGTPVHEGRPA